MQRNPWGASPNVWHEDNAPLTKILIGLSALGFLLAQFKPSFAEALTFVAPFSLAQPWRIFTYPIIATQIVSLLFYALTLWWVGSSLERSWGSKFFGAFFAAMSAVTAIGMSIGAALFGFQAPVYWGLPFGALLLAWCMINPELEINIYGIFPVKAKYLGVGECLIIFFTNMYPSPLMGVFALSGCGAAFLWVKTRSWSDVHLYSLMPVSRKAKPKLKLVPQRTPKPKDDRFTIRDLNPLEWIARRRRRKQFEKLMSDD